MLVVCTRWCVFAVVGPNLTNVGFYLLIGHWNNTSVEYRTCIFCNNDIGDEFHYLFMCMVFLQSLAIHY